MGEESDRIVREAAEQVTLNASDAALRLYATVGQVVGDTLRVVAENAKVMAQEGWTLREFSEALLAVEETPDPEDAVE